MSGRSPAPAATRSRWSRSCGRGRLAQQVAAELADVDEGDGLVPAHVVEEGRGGELPARRERAAGAERGREADEEALAVVERQRGVDRLALLDAEHLGEADAAHA